MATSYPLGTRQSVSSGRICPELDSHDDFTTVADRNSSSTIRRDAVSSHPSVSSCSTTSGGPMCRICQEGPSKNRKLITPCYCAGSMGFFHACCLERWLGQSASNHCEVCNYEFQTVRVDRTFKEWLRSPRSERDRRYMWADSTCFLLLTPLGSVSSWLCINGAWQYHEDGDDWTAFGLVMLTTFLSLMYVLWAVITVRYHCRIFRKWRRRNQIVKVVLKDRQPEAQSQKTETPAIVDTSETSFVKVSAPCLL